MRLRPGCGPPRDADADGPGPTGAAGPIDHLVVGVPDLERGVAQLRDITGEEPLPGGAHPHLGTANCTMTLDGRTYLELLGPGSCAGPASPLATRLRSLNGPRLIGFAIEVDMARAVRRAREHGYLLEVISGSRNHADGSSYAYCGAYLGDGLFDDLLVFVVDWDGSPHPSECQAERGSLSGLAVLVPEVDPAAHLLQDVMRAPVQVLRRAGPVALEAAVAFRADNVRFYSHADPDSVPAHEQTAPIDML